MKLSRAEERRARITAYLAIAEAIYDASYAHTTWVGDVMREQAEIYRDRVSRIQRFNRIRGNHAAERVTTE